VLAQPFTPHIGYVYPAGAQRGAACEVAVGGQFLEGVTNAFVSGAGVQAEVVDFHKPMPQGQFNNLRDQMKELQDQKQAAFKDARRGARTSTNTWTASDEKKLTEIREKILKNPPNRNATVAIAEVASVKLTVADDAEPGEREIRLGTPNGLSNPLVFHVGRLPEFSKPAAQAPNPEADRFLERLGRKPPTAPTRSEMRIRLPSVVNGQIMPGAVDRFRFAAQRGQRLVVAASARALIPYLPDAVPGWFQATLALYDAKGKELQYTDDYRFHPDPVLFYEIPADGDYAVEIRDAIYRGREDFVYRVTVGELPFVTSLFPLGGPAGQKTPVELKGWNLPVNHLTIDPRADSPGSQPIFVRQDEHISNFVPFAVEALPECLEQEPNSTDATAQTLTLPVIVNGRIDSPGDADVFRFEGKAGGEIVAEVSARRLNSPLDSMLRLTDATGRQLAFNDDHEDKGAGLTTHHADARLSAKLPSDGVYRIHLGDTQRKGGPEYAYRLRLSPPRPDFELRVVPSSVSLRGGVTLPVTLYALRKDGFSGAIALALKDAASGFVLSGARVPPGQDQVRVTLTAPFTPPKEPVTLQLEGRAVIEGREVARPVVPAEDMMQAFAYRHLVPAKELKVAVSSRFAQRPVRFLGETPVKIPAGGIARIQIDAPGRGFADRAQLELSEPPEGIGIKSVSPSRSGTEIVLECNAAKAKPGLAGNLIVNAFAARADAPGRGKPQAAAPRRAPMGTLPAIPFEVVPR
jgi:hypothetical protein